MHVHTSPDPEPFIHRSGRDAGRRAGQAHSPAGRPRGRTERFPGLLGRPLGWKQVPPRSPVPSGRPFGRPPEVFCPGAVRCESLQSRPRAFPGAAGPTQRFPRPRLPPRAPGPGCCSGSLEASLCAALPDSSPQPGPPDAPHLGQELIRPGCPRPLTVSPAGCLPRRMTSRWGPP